MIFEAVQYALATALLATAYMFAMQVNSIAKSCSHVSCRQQNANMACIKLLGCVAA